MKITPDVFAALCRQRELPEPEAEHRFSRPRRHKFDFAWPAPYLLALEIEGGLYGRGEKCLLCGRRRAAGHSSIDRTMRDMEKYNLAAVMGWRVLRCTVQEFERGDALALVGLAFTKMGVT